MTDTPLGRLQRECEIQDSTGCCMVSGEDLALALKALAVCQEFIDRVDYVESHPALTGVFAIAEMHGCPYKGPQYGKELSSAKEALSLLTSTERKE